MLKGTQEAKTGPQIALGSHDSWRAGLQEAQELAPKDPFQALLGLRPQASPCPTHPLFQWTDSAPVPSLCSCAQSLGPGWQPGWGQDSETCGS